MHVTANFLLIGPFTQLSGSILNVTDLRLVAQPSTTTRTVNPVRQLPRIPLLPPTGSDGFGPDDKLNVCGSSLVFIDLDSDGDWFAYSGGQWSTGPITLNNNCTSGINLIPRSQGYIVRALPRPTPPNSRRLSHFARMLPPPSRAGRDCDQQ